MNNVEFYINGSLADYQERSDFNLAIWKKIQNLDNLSAKSGEFTRTVKLPMTSNNNKILNIIDRTDTNKLLPASLPCQVDIGGVTMLQGRLYIQSVDLKEKVIEAFIIGNSVSWTDLIKGKTLQEINFAPSIFHGMNDALQNDIDLEFKMIPFTHNQTHNCIFPMISFGQYFLPNSWDNATFISNQYYRNSNNLGSGVNPIPLPTTPIDRTIFGAEQYYVDRWSNAHFSIEDIPPAIYLVNVMKQIFTDAGYRLQGAWLNDDEINKIVLPAVSNQDGWNWAFLAKAKANSPLVTRTLALNLLGFSGSSIVLDIQQQTFSTVGTDTSITGNGTCGIELFILSYPYNNDSYKLCGYYIPFFTRGNIAINVFSGFLNGDKAITFDDIEYNRSFSLYPKEDDYAVYFAPATGRYRISVDYHYKGTTHINVVWNAFSLPPPTYFGHLIINPEEIIGRRVALIIRKVAKDSEVLDYGVLQFGTAQVGDELIGFDVFAIAGYFVTINTNRTITIEANVNKGERIEVYLVLPIIGTIVDNIAITYHENIEVQFTRLEIDYISPVIEDNVVLTQAEQVVFDKKSSPLFHPELFLPPISQLDFVKEVIKLFNLYIGFDEADNTVYLERRDQYYLPAAYAVDLSPNARFGTKRRWDSKKFYEFAYKQDEADYYFNVIAQFNPNFLISNPNQAQNEDIERIQLSLFAATSFRDYKIVRADVASVTGAQDFVNPVFTTLRIVSIPTFATKENLELFQNSIDAPSQEFELRILKIKGIRPLSQVPILDPSFTQGTASRAYVKSGGHQYGFSVRTWDDVLKVERVHWGVEINTIPKIEMLGYEVWQFQLDLTFVETDNNFLSLTWNGVNGLYNNFWRSTINTLFATFEYEIDVQLTNEMFKRLNGGRVPVAINGDVFLVNEIRGFNLLEPTVTEMRLLKLI